MSRRQRRIVFLVGMVVGAGVGALWPLSRPPMPWLSLGVLAGLVAVGVWLAARPGAKA